MPEEELSPLSDDTAGAETGVIAERPPRRWWTGTRVRLEAVALLITFGLGLGSGYVVWGAQAREVSAARARDAKLDTQVAELAAQVNPEQGFVLPATYGDIGPRLLQAGAFDLATFLDLYEQRGQPLTEEQQALLKGPSDSPVVINRQNANFLLNFFWAFGLVNENRILKEGAMVKNSGGKIEGYASTGGWTLAFKPVTMIYASTPIVKLTDEQQARLEEVAGAAFRPCCGNSTSFPDCNHGMALLGLLELMASQDASVDQMFLAAKQVNAFWFPQQSLELALYFQVSEGKDFEAVDARRFIDAEHFSSSGFQRVRQELAAQGLGEKPGGGGGSCGV